MDADLMIDGKPPNKLPIGQLRKELATRGLSPMGDKAEMVKLLVDFLKSQKATIAAPASAPEATTAGALDAVDVAKKVLDLAELMDWEGVLSVLGGARVDATTPTALMRKQYMKISLLIHPDKLSKRFKEATKAFQALVSAFDRLTQPELYAEEEEAKSKTKGKKSKKPMKIQRSNDGCKRTRINCPRCRVEWGTAITGVEPYFYNFMMQGLKTYTCATCLLQFGCMTATHVCPFCSSTFEYDPKDFHRKIKCGNKGCDKEFGFFEYHVSERVEKELREELRVTQEKWMKERAARERRAKGRGGGAIPGANGSAKSKAKGSVSNSTMEEKAFAMGLQDVCPRCGAEGFAGADEQAEHLGQCADALRIKAYQQRKATQAKAEAHKSAAQNKQEEVAAMAAWQFMGSETGELWRLTLPALTKLCVDSGIDAAGTKEDLIGRLAKHRNQQQAGHLLTTGGGEDADEDPAPSAKRTKVVREAIPTNLHSMPMDQLRAVCAANSIPLPKGAASKSHLIKAIETALYHSEENEAVLLLE